MRNRFWKKAVSIVVALSMCNGLTDLAVEAKEAILEPVREEQEFRDMLEAMGEEGSQGIIAFWGTEDITVSEGDGSYEIKVVRMGSTEGEAFVQFKAVDINAGYGEDYVVSLKESYGREQTVSVNSAAESIMDQMADSANASAAYGDVITDISGNDADLLSDGETDSVSDNDNLNLPKLPDSLEEKSDEEIVVSSLREAKSVQTGKISDQPDWRGQYEQNRLMYQLEKDAAKAAANQLVNQIEGHSMVLNFADGEYCKVLKVSVIDDTIAEGKEAACFLLGDTINASLGDAVQRKFMIEDNDAEESIVYAMADTVIYADRADAKAVVTINRTSGNGKYSSVYVSTASDTAQANVDYISCNSQVVTFKAGETRHQLEIPLLEGGSGGHFYVMLDTDSMNIEEGLDKAEIYIRDSIRETIPVQGQTDIKESQGLMAAPRALEKSTVQYQDGSVWNIYRQWNVEYVGAMTCDVATITGDYGWLLVQAHGEYADTYKYLNNESWFSLNNVVYVKANYTLSGSHKIGLTRYYEKQGWIGIGGNDNVFYEYLRDHKNNNSVNFTNGTFLSAGQRFGNYSIKVRAKSYWWNENCDINMDSVKLYYPKYSLSFQEGNNTAGTRIYTGKNSSKNGDTITLGRYDNRKGSISVLSGNINILPNGIHKDAFISKYRVFMGGVEVGSLNGNQTTVSYQELFNIHMQNAGSVKENVTSVIIEPVYELYPAKVLLQSQNTNLMDFKDAKAGDIIDCRRIDSIQVTGVGSKGFQPQSIQLTSYAVDSGDDARALQDSLLNNKYVRKSSTPVSVQMNSNTAVVNDLKSYNYIKVYHTQPVLTVQYDPDEILQAGSPDYEKWLQLATCGIIGVYNSAGEGNLEGGETSLGVSDLRKKLTVDSGITLSNPIRTEFIRGQDALIPVPDPNHPTNRYFAKWKYLEPYRNDKGEVLLKSDGSVLAAWNTVTGDGFQLTPYQANTTLNYYFTFDTMNLVKPIISGEVTIKEVPLFSKTDTAKEMPAVGVKINLAGKSVTTNNDGRYSIECEVPKGNNMSGYLQYGTLKSYITLPADNRDNLNYKLSANTSDGIRVVSSKIYKDVKYTSGGILASAGAIVTQIKNEEVEGVSLDDTNYTFQVQTQGEGDIIPAKAAFRFLDKYGNVRVTQMVDVDSDNRGLFVLTVNPQTLNLKAGDVLTVQFYDQNEKAYFQHQTEVIILKVYSQGLCMWNYQNTKSVNDSLAESIMGNVSMGFDMILDSISGSYGIHQEKIIDANGNEVNEKHQIYGFGFGEGSSSERGYETARAVVQGIKDAGTKGVTLFHDDSLNMFSSNAEKGESSWNIGIKMGVYLDLIAGDGSNDMEKGEWYFNDFLLVGQVDAGYSYEKQMNISCLSFYLTLGFTMQDTGIEWHWEYDTGKRVPLSDSSVLNLVSGDETYGEGKLQIKGKVMGKANIGLGSGSLAFIGLGGKLEIAPTMVFAYNRVDGNGKWTNNGSLMLAPSFYIKASVFEIPLWKDEFKWKWGPDPKSMDTLPALNSAMEDMMWEEDILRTSTAQSCTEERDYLENRSVWMGGVQVLKGSETAKLSQRLQETVLLNGFYPNADIAMENIGNGRYLAVFTDDDARRDEYNKKALYYSIYDGHVWSNPVKLEEDGLGDEVPVICKAGSKGYLIAWSAAEKAASEEQEVGAVLNTYNIHGVFYNPLDDSMGKIQEITKTTTYDQAGDARPQISYYEGDGSTDETLMVYYTKNEYSVSNQEEGEVVGDILNPYSVLVSRFYDFTKDQWKDTYSQADKAEIMKNSGMDEAAFRKYEENFYGQLFLDLAPVVSVEETLDDDGFWAKDVNISSYTGQKDPVVTDSANIAYNHLSLMAYVMDNDGDTETVGDRNIYLQIYNMQDKEFHHPVMITSEQADCSNLQLLRAGDSTYLYWLENGEIRQMNLSSIVKDRLLERMSAGRKYYIVDKTSPEKESEDRAAYLPSSLVVKAPQEKAVDEPQEILTVMEGEQEGLNKAHINEFMVKNNGDCIYLMWSETGLAGEENEEKTYTRLMVSREIWGQELSAPVVLAQKEGCNYMGTDFAVTEQGGILALSCTVDINEKTRSEEASGRLVALDYQPEKTAVIGEPEYGAPFREDGLYQPVQVKITNEDVLTIENIRAVWTDTQGNMLEEKTFHLDGGRSILLNGKVPMTEEGDYCAALTIYDGAKVLDQRTVEGKASAFLSADDFTVQTQDRSSLAVKAEVTNNSVFHTGVQNAELGYLDEEGEKHMLHTFRVPSLEQGEIWKLEETIKADYNVLFPEKRQEDGTVSSVREFYLEIENVEMVVPYTVAGLNATAAQIALMDSISELTMDPVNLKVDEVMSVSLRSAGKEVSRETIDSGLKIVWEPDDQETAVLTSDGYIVGQKEGTVQITGYIMPFDSEFQAQDNCEALAIDNYSTLPSSLIQKVTAVITVSAKEEEIKPDPDDGSGGSSGSDSEDETGENFEQKPSDQEPNNTDRRKSPATGDLYRDPMAVRAAIDYNPVVYMDVWSWLYLAAAVAVVFSAVSAGMWSYRKKKKKTGK